MFRDMQKDIILGFSQETIALFEESSREKILEAKLDEIMNWGVNKDIFVMCYGDKYEVTKIYF